MCNYEMILEKLNDHFNFETKTASRWQQVSVLMSESLTHSLNWFIQTVDSFSHWIIN